LAIFGPPCIARWACCRAWLN